MGYLPILIVILVLTKCQIACKQICNYRIFNVSSGYPKYKNPKSKKKRGFIVQPLRSPKCLPLAWMWTYTFSVSDLRFSCQTKLFFYRSTEKPQVQRSFKTNGNPFTGYQGFTGDTGYCGNEKKRGDSWFVNHESPPPSNLSKGLCTLCARF